MLAGGKRASVGLLAGIAGPLWTIEKVNQMKEEEQLDK